MSQLLRDDLVWRGHIAGRSCSGLEMLEKPREFLSRGLYRFNYLIIDFCHGSRIRSDATQQNE
jgi:hypothetical protein